jgi:hypothetical protein
MTTLVSAPARWYLKPVHCTAFSLRLVLLQSGVWESLYGVSGDDGPHSSHGAPSSSAIEPSPESPGDPSLRESRCFRK